MSDCLLFFEPVIVKHVGNFLDMSSVKKMDRFDGRGCDEVSVCYLITKWQVQSGYRTLSLLSINGRESSAQM